MNEEKHIENGKACYRPAEIMTSFLTEALRLEKEAEEIQKEIIAGGITQKSIIKRQEKWKSDKLNLNKRKVGLLDDCIFPSMANLTVLLEAMANSGFIEHIFVEDLKSLFFAKSKALSIKSKLPGERYKASRAIFARFLNATCALEIHKPESGEHIELDESRAVLCDMMMEAVHSVISKVGEKGIGQLKFGNTLGFLNKTLGPDLDRVRAWTQLFAWEAGKKLTPDEDRRPALF